MVENLITFLTAKLAKEKGFNELCGYAYEGSFLNETERLWRNDEDDTEYAVCTQSLLQKWLREIHKIDISIYPSLIDNYYVYTIHKKHKCIIDCEKQYLNYEEALENGLQEALNLIK